MESLSHGKEKSGRRFTPKHTLYITKKKKKVNKPAMNLHEGVT